MTSDVDLIFTVRLGSLRGGNVFSSVCLSICLSVSHSFNQKLMKPSQMADSSEESAT